MAEVLMCEVELDNSHREKSIELLALESLVQLNFEIRTNEENGKKAMPCEWPCSQKDVETSKRILEEKIFQSGEKEEEKMLKEKWKTNYYGPCSREEELQAFYMSELSEEELSSGEESDEKEEDNDYYLDLTGLIMDLLAGERQEYGKSNLKSEDGFDEVLKKHSAELQGLQRKHKVVWLCDQASASTFLTGLPPESPRLRRWWVFLSQLRLHMHHIQGLKNELSDYLSRTNFHERLQVKSEWCEIHRHSFLLI